MTESNSTINSNEDAFFVLATKEIQTARNGVIYPGNHVMIAPCRKPEAGNMVVIDNHLEEWNEQPVIRGVAVGVHISLVAMESSEVHHA
jgi:hypothetical protein